LHTKDLSPQTIVSLGLASRFAFAAFAYFRLSDGGKKALFCEFTKCTFALCTTCPVSDNQLSPWQFLGGYDNASSE
jgi:hypothetical protein